MKKLVTIILFLSFFMSKSKAQVAISYNPFQTVIGIGTDSDKQLWFDLRIATNTFIANTNLEPNLFYNFSVKEQANIYVGAGVNFNPFNGYQNVSIINGYDVVLGSRIRPFEKFPKGFIQFEISPYVNRYFDSGRLRTMLGLGYNL